MTDQAVVDKSLRSVFGGNRLRLEAKTLKRITPHPRKRKIPFASNYAIAAKVLQRNENNNGKYIMCLNVLRPDLLPSIRFSLVEYSPNPTFKASLEVDSRTFVGRGGSKAEAKSALSREIVSYLFSQYNGTAGTDNILLEKIPPSPQIQPSNSIDTAAAVGKGDVIYVEKAAMYNSKYGLILVKWVDNAAISLSQGNATVPIGKNPPLSYKKIHDDLSPVINSNDFLQEFNLLYSLLSNDVEFKACHNEGKFVFVAFKEVDDSTFIGHGTSKSEAKKQLLKGLYLYLRYLPVANRIVRSYVPPSVCNPADVIAHLVKEKYSQLVANFSTDYFKTYKVVSGIVMVYNERYENGTVVSISTGNKCMDGVHFSDAFKHIRDSHAEVLVRRGFVRYLFAQLENYRKGRRDTIFARGRDGKLRLKRSVSFHLYVSSAPCGDCRIFVTSNADAAAATAAQETATVKNASSNYTNEGTLRVKVENGCGTIPAKNFGIEIQKCESASGYIPRLLIMSCSDKLLKTNVVGVQGTFLTRFIEPIYYKSIVIGDFFQQEHAKRGLYKRLEAHVGDNWLLPPYRLNKPRVLQTSTTIEEARCKQISHCVNWNASDRYVEILNERSGETFMNMTSRLSSYDIMKKYMQALYHGVGGGSNTNNNYEAAASKKLDEVMATTYRNFKHEDCYLFTHTSVKVLFHDTLKQAGLGNWIFIHK